MAREGMKAQHPPTPCRQSPKRVLLEQKPPYLGPRTPATSELPGVFCQTWPTLYRVLPYFLARRTSLGPYQFRLTAAHAVHAVVPAGTGAEHWWQAPGCRLTCKYRRFASRALNPNSCSPPPYSLLEASSRTSAAYCCSCVAVSPIGKTMVMPQFRHPIDGRPSGSVKSCFLLSRGMRRDVKGVSGHFSQVSLRDNSGFAFFETSKVANGLLQLAKHTAISPRQVSASSKLQSKPMPSHPRRFRTPRLRAIGWHGIRSRERH